ncbi:2-amino-4-hydroxy-6-hydroxymethyldihydropteridinepyrophosphokinase [Legionella beliardensis]|uniref:2-amino-4-hydroxy-6-hydroxymethyldihydropteridine pyrophosphokinase n=1 Tax=Legionella beliardensis TaxID=91822 RepID=A0A378I2E2_9GAMM|nr:2-amino-4-hydroxy-6-hydroxymethyldihydropteridine diphosphokinase [Legionella beliardensis]STX29122.1 2-amino-4-hydroxy-6-hydroxymethyldihydropteridinepyrophosphokinase [Legionella beliardensis]
MILCYLALGSNLNSPQRQLQLAIKQLQSLPHTHVKKIATFYKNQAVGRKSQPSFYNTVVEISTTLPPEKLLAKCQEIERKQGRIRRVRWSARTIDIDILLYDNQVIKRPYLVIPHPQLLNRDFVLIPLIEIAPAIRLPNGQPIGLKV